MKFQDLYEEKGTVPVPPYSSAHKSDDTILPVQVVSHLGGAPIGGGETPVEHSGFLKTVLHT